ncbi:MAG: hydrogenase maturation nickel metallochaperone HypA [Atopobiaceae bacterium]|nr:hydrogenase maturation nickel metallochaperone HypA [Atopobiaceae bacterium]MBR1829665.1 hydrogenase maturation nickel metallochaperone HypA [Atopobiaceae bacterium]
MHELGIVFHMIETLEEVGAQNELTAIRKVTLNLGEVSGVLPDYLLDCWRWAADRSGLLQGAELEIVPIAAVTVCNACGKTYGTIAHGKICPHCGSPDTVLLCGNEAEIDTIEGW